MMSEPMVSRRTRFDDLLIDEDLLYAAMEEARRVLASPAIEERLSGNSARKPWWRGGGRWIGGLTGGTFLMVILAAASIVGSHGTYRVVLVGLIVVGALAGFVLLCGARQARSRRRDIRAALNRRGFELCLDCGYSLQDLPLGSNRCPECGAPREPMLSTASKQVHAAESKP